MQAAQQIIIIGGSDGSGSGGPLSEVELIGTLIGSANVGKPQLVLSPGDITNAVWTNTNINASTATTFTESTTNGNHQVAQVVTKSASSAFRYTVSCTASQALRTRIVLTAFNGASGTFAVFDLAGGQVGVVATTYGSGFSISAAASIASDGLGHWICQYDLTTNSGSTLTVGVQSDNGSGTGAVSNSFAGNAGSVALNVISVTAIPFVSTGRVLANLTDGDFATWWDASDSQAWAGIDMGAGVSVNFTRYRFAPRPGDSGTGTGTGILYDYEMRAVGALAQISADQTFASGVTTLDTVPASPFYPPRQLNERAISGSNRAARILMPAASYGSLAELRFFGTYQSTKNAKPVAPTISPWGGRFPTGSTTVTIASLTRQAKIYYTTDGSTPTAASTLYAGPFTLTIGASAVTLKTIAIDATLNTTSSDVVSAIYAPWAFKPNEDWYDDRGILIEAHDGGITYDPSDGRYYWFGNFTNLTQPTSGTNVRQNIGVFQYSSADLCNWRYEGQILDNAGFLYNFRPHVIYNAATAKWVLWTRMTSSTALTNENAGIATASSIKGPWTWVNTAYNPDNVGFHDCSLFVDPIDGVTAYVVYTRGNQNGVRIDKLASDYLSTVNTVELAATSREAPQLWSQGGVYFLITSIGNFYDSTLTMDLRYIVSSGGNPQTGWGAMPGTALFASDPVGGSFNGQSSFILLPQGKTQPFIGTDFWNKTQLRNSRQVWVPLTFPTSTTMRATTPASWALSDLA